MEGIILPIVLYIVGIFILYVVIETAVRRGINSSIVGKSLEKQDGMDVNKKSFLDHDLDNED
ncbi:hypothetical protein [Guptibacillus hwajinpoensis]|uniref:Uncharacterized protein n=1 Tax=Guptibacillus hwajinpoensis TaxID=208199 RepID=A0ABU0K3I0_9BACL|nr:hypothetical protein [Alkalihalobacillus hemicentroti]MDQ0483891.1 hypothetical protein [Alkalihalobacillus hemicentroti]